MCSLLGESKANPGDEKNVSDGSTTATNGNKNNNASEAARCLLKTKEAHLDPATKLWHLKPTESDFIDDEATNKNEVNFLGN